MVGIYGQSSVKIFQSSPITLAVCIATTESTFMTHMKMIHMIQTFMTHSIYEMRQTCQQISSQHTNNWCSMTKSTYRAPRATNASTLSASICSALLNICIASVSRPCLKWSTPSATLGTDAYKWHAVLLTLYGYYQNSLKLSGYPTQLNCMLHNCK